MYLSEFLRRLGLRVNPRIQAYVRVKPTTLLVAISRTTKLRSLSRQVYPSDSRWNRIYVILSTHLREWLSRVELCAPFGDGSDERLPVVGLTRSFEGTIYIYIYIYYRASTCESGFLALSSARHSAMAATNDSRLLRHLCCVVLVVCLCL